MNLTNVTTERIQLLKSSINVVLEFCEFKGFPLKSVITEGQPKPGDDRYGPQLLSLAEDIERIDGIENEHAQFMALHDLATRIERTLADVLIFQYRSFPLEKQHDRILDVLKALRELAMVCEKDEKSPWGKCFFGIEGQPKMIGYAKKLERAAVYLSNQFSVEVGEVYDDPYLCAQVWSKAEETSNIVRGYIRQACQKMITGGPNE